MAQGKQTRTAMQMQQKPAQMQQQKMNQQAMAQGQPPMPNAMLENIKPF